MQKPIYTTAQVECRAWRFTFLIMCLPHTMRGDREIGKHPSEVVMQCAYYDALSRLNMGCREYLSTSISPPRISNYGVLSYIEHPYHLPSTQSPGIITKERNISSSCSVWCVQQVHCSHGLICDVTVSTTLNQGQASQTLSMGVRKARDVQHCIWGANVNWKLLEASVSSGIQPMGNCS